MYRLVYDMVFDMYGSLQFFYVALTVDLNAHFDQLTPIPPYNCEWAS